MVLSFRLGLTSCVFLALLAGCSSTASHLARQDQHLFAPPASSTPVAADSKQLDGVATPATPPASIATATYSISVNKLPVHELLFALARDANINADIHPALQGKVTLTAINQPLEKILARIARQVDLRWQIQDATLHVEPDTPYLKAYQVDYLTLARTTRIHTGIANSISPTGKQSGLASSNSSSTEIRASSEHTFWKRLERNLHELLTERIETDAQSAIDKEVTPATEPAQQNPAETAMPDSATATSAARTGKQSASNLIMHPESGVIMVHASQRQHAKVAEFLERVGLASLRQIMLEATVVEVSLSDQYQAGIDWSRIAQGSNWSLTQTLTGAALGSNSPLGMIGYDNGLFRATLKLLEQFGRTRVLSSPRIMALNNQTAVMKVVDEQVYFRLSIEEDKNEAGNIVSRTYTSELHTVPVGLVMQVTPQISSTNQIMLNVRPTITNISSYAEDPAVAIVSATSDLGVKSLVPNLQVREFDSTLAIPSGQIAMLGGLIQDKQINQRNGLPGLSRLPFIGDLFSYREDTVQKIELVVFIKPVAVMAGTSFAAQHGMLPKQDFFATSADHALSAWHSGNPPAASQGPQP